MIRNIPNKYNNTLFLDEINQELEIFDLLISSLPISAKLRLDANGGLTYQEAELWLQKCDQFLPKIEFIEQPLAVDKFREMQELSNSYFTTIALDESIANLHQLELCFQRGLIFYSFFIFILYIR
jgi:O-succinylbenzoate synthase